MFDEAPPNRRPEVAAGHRQPDRVTLVAQAP